MKVLGCHSILQIYIVYDRNKKLFCGVATFILLATVATLVLWIFYLPVGEAILTLIFRQNYDDNHHPAGRKVPHLSTLTGCYVPTMSRIFFVCEVPVLATEVTLCVCMVYKAWMIYINDYGSPILKLLIRDRLV